MNSVFFEEPRRGTGRTFLIEIPNCKRSTIEAAIRKYLREGSVVWTDGHKSYKWMCQGVQRGVHSPVSGYAWDWVNHKQVELMRDTGVERVSTNGVESLVGRMKKFVRSSRVTNVHNQRYTLHLAEFLWRERFLSRRFLGSSAWELPAVWLLADLIANVHHSSSMKNITGPLMNSTTATQLETLRKNCCPDVPAVPRPPAAVPAAPVARPPVAPVVHTRPLAEPAQPSRSSTFSLLKKSTTRIVVDLDTSDDDIVQLVPKRLKVDHQLPFVAAPQMPVLDGYASSSGGSFRDDFDDVASVTDSIESVGGIETPTGSPPSPLLPHAPDPEVGLAPLSHRLRNVRARPLFPDNVRPQPRVHRQQQAVVEVPEGEPREHTTMRTGGTYNVRYYSVRMPDGYNEIVFVRSSKVDMFCV